MNFKIEEADVGARLDKLLVRHAANMGRASAKRLFAEGRVLICAADGRKRRAQKGDIGNLGDVIEVELEAQELGDAAVPDPAAPLSVVLERDDLVVVEKPAGQATAPLSPGERGTVANALVAKYPEMASVGFSPREPGLCHRLDTDTSGLVLAARSKLAFSVLTGALKQGRFDKRYLLLCVARDLPDSGTIEIPLCPHPKDRRRVYGCVHPRDVARYAPRPAMTSYKKLCEHAEFALVEASAPKALRHQIRAHFAAIDHPLLGDVLYGGPEIPGLTRHALHAYRIAWGGDRDVSAFTVLSELPNDLSRLVTS